MACSTALWVVTFDRCRRAVKSARAAPFASRPGCWGVETHRQTCRFSLIVHPFFGIAGKLEILIDHKLAHFLLLLSPFIKKAGIQVQTDTQWTAGASFFAVYRAGWLTIASTLTRTVNFPQSSSERRGSSSGLILMMPSLILVFCYWYRMTDEGEKHIFIAVVCKKEKNI